MSHSSPPPELNPFASPRLAEDRAGPVRTPRWWGVWMLVDTLYLGLFCAGLIAAPLSGVAFFLTRLAMAGGVDSRAFGLAVSFGVCTAFQAALASLLFGLVLAIAPRTPIFVLRVLAVLLPPLAHPLTILFARSPGAGALVGSLACVIVGSIGTSFALFIAAQNMRQFLEPLARLAPSGGYPAKLTVQSWMRRVLEVALPEGTAVIDYDGRKIGSERVLVNGATVQRRMSGLQLAPRFDFTIGPHRCELQVTGWPWPALRSLVLAVDGTIVYREGI